MTAVDSDFSCLEGSCCYCSEESAARIRASVAALPLGALHLIGTGDYHYISLFYLERVAVPFYLLLLDNHPDDQPGAFGGELLSCGSWVAEARKLPLLRGSYHIRQLQELSQLPSDGLPLYISLDLDVLSSDYARTDWDQGTMTLSEMKRAVLQAAAAHPLLGADLCGGLTREKGARDEDIAINEETVEELTVLFDGLDIIG